MTDDEGDELDADDFPGSPLDAPVTDDDLPYVVLFAGVAPEDVDAHADQLRQVLGEPEPAAPAKARSVGKRRAP